MSLRKQQIGKAESQWILTLASTMYNLHILWPKNFWSSIFLSYKEKLLNEMISKVSFKFYKHVDQKEKKKQSRKHIITMPPK